MWRIAVVAVVLSFALTGTSRAEEPAPWGDCIPRPDLGVTVIQCGDVFGSYWPPVGYLQLPMIAAD